MAELLGALVEAIVGLCMAAVHLVGALLESLGFAVGHLAHKPVDGQRRFATERLAVALAPLLMIVIGVPGMWWFLSWRNDIQQKRVDAVRIELARMGESIILDRNADGRVTWPPKCELPTNDAWGNRFILECEEAAVHQVVTLTSVGPDQKRGTIDDIVQKLRIALKKREIGKKAFDHMRDALLGGDDDEAE